MTSRQTACLDALGLRCPLPVLKARKRLEGMPAGSTLVVIADDPASLIDIPHFCNEHGHVLLRQTARQDGASWEFALQSAATPLAEI